MDKYNRVCILCGDFLNLCKAFSIFVTSIFSLGSKHFVDGMCVVSLALTMIIMSGLLSVLL